MTELKTAPAKAKRDISRQLSAAKLTLGEVQNRISGLNDEFLAVGKFASNALADATQSPAQGLASKKVQAASAKPDGPSSADFLSSALGTPNDCQQTASLGPDGGKSLDQPALEKARAQSVPVYLLDLEHLTADSDNR